MMNDELKPCIPYGMYPYYNIHVVSLSYKDGKSK